MVNPFVFHRGEITQSAVEPFWVIERFDVIEDGRLGLVVSLELVAMEPFGFEGAPERFHGGVVVTVAFAAHAGKGFESGKEGTIIGAGVLAATIGVME